MSVFPEFEAGLYSAAARAATSYRRGRRLRLVVLAAVAVALLAGAALAATGVWAPQLGNPKYGKPTVGKSVPPSDQLRVLGVLRRPQTVADRGPQTRSALRFLGPNSRGVRLAYVRLLALRADGRGFVLVPVERYDPGPAPTAAWRRAFAPKENALCVFAQASDGGGKACYSTREVLSGRASAGSVGRETYGLVPDGVAAVRLQFVKGQTFVAKVKDNFFVADSPPERKDARHSPAAAVAVETWLDEGGRPLSRHALLGAQGPPTTGGP
jgi:hypothetical protein